MSTTVQLPSSLRQRIAAVARRVRLLRAVRGLSLVLVLLALTAGAAAMADYWLDLPAATRQAVFSAWTGLGLIAFLSFVVLPLGRRLHSVRRRRLEYHRNRLHQRRHRRRGVLQPRADLDRDQ